MAKIARACFHHYLFMSKLCFVFGKVQITEQRLFVTFNIKERV